MIQTNVLIVGAGPAGAMCAYLLKKAGVECLLIDHAKFPRDKICGGGLTSKSWHLLQQLIPDFNYAFNPVNKIRLDIDGKVQCEFTIDEPIRIVQRRVFDHALLQQYIAIGGTFRQAALNTLEEQPDGSIIAILKSGERITCHYVVGADGSNSRVRRYLKPDTDRGIFVMEQYVEKRPENCIDVKLSESYTRGGYYYRFPTNEFDAVGFGDTTTTLERFRSVMREQGVPAGKERGAYIYLSNDYPLHPNIILIGDAGGFAHRITCEGLYNSFCTARNAATAIIEQRPFKETNAAIFRKMRHEERVSNYFYSHTGFMVLKWVCSHPSLTKKIFERKMKRGPQ